MSNNQDMLNIIGLLENNEWAEHCTNTVLGSLLESEITRLVSKEQPAPVVPLSITLPDTSSKAFWSGTGKKEVFHPETYKRWVKEAIERSCMIAGIAVEVKS